ncbi:MAG TPA: DUF3613 domain-containing protein [Solimonas sp.]|nr:DUF3613 domain-containing protein [Solimonas sp.]
MKKSIAVLLPALLLSTLPAVAADETPPPGSEARAWLDLQRSGAAASRTPPTTSGEVADRVYQRYLQSFEHPLPERFEREEINTGGGSGSSGSQ